MVVPKPRSSCPNLIPKAAVKKETLEVGEVQGLASPVLMAASVDLSTIETGMISIIRLSGRHDVDVISGGESVRRDGDNRTPRAGTHAEEAAGVPLRCPTSKDVSCVVVMIKRRGLERRACQGRRHAKRGRRGGYLIVPLHMLGLMSPIAAYLSLHPPPPRPPPRPTPPTPYYTLTVTVRALLFAIVFFCVWSISLCPKSSVWFDQALARLKNLCYCALTF